MRRGRADFKAKPFQFARRVANRCVFMDKGEIVEIAPTEEFFAAPRSDRLRAFIAQILH